MRRPRSFLVVAEDSERLLLISNTLQRKFPNSVVQTCRDAEAALLVVQSQTLDAVVAHRSVDMDEIPLVEHLRTHTKVPIVMMGSEHHARRATEAGASIFLHQDEWLLIGTAVAELVGATAKT